MEEQEKSIAITHSFIAEVIEALKIGFENTEEVFISNGSRNTRTERESAKRLEYEMTYIGNIISELKTAINGQ